MGKERSWAMEWLVNQPLHFLMGAGLCGGIVYGIHRIGHDTDYLSIPWWWAYPVGILVTRAVWMVRESRQKNYQYIVWNNRDLGFIDLGIAASVITLLFLGNAV